MTPLPRHCLTQSAANFVRHAVTIGKFAKQRFILKFLFPSFSPQMILAFLDARGGLPTARKSGTCALEFP